MFLKIMFHLIILITSILVVIVTVNGLHVFCIAECVHEGKIHIKNRVHAHCRPWRNRKCTLPPVLYLLLLMLCILRFFILKQKRVLTFVLFSQRF